MTDGPPFPLGAADDLASGFLIRYGMMWRLGKRECRLSRLDIGAFNRNMQF